MSSDYNLEVKQGGILWFYLAYISLLLSYLNVNILIFRLFLILASLFFILGAVLFGCIWLDSILFNSSMILINIYRSIPLIKQKINVKLNNLEETIYFNCFQKCMDKRTFKKIFDAGCFHHVTNNTYIVQQGNPYNGLYLIVYLNKKNSVKLYENDIQIHEELSYYKWLGLIEYDILRKAKEDNDKASINWPISIKVENKSSQNSENNFKDDENIHEYKYSSETLHNMNEALYVIHFKLDDLNKLFQGENGTFIKNSLHSIWLESLTHKILTIDKKLVELSEKFDSNQMKKKKSVDIVHVELSNKNNDIERSGVYGNNNLNEKNLSFSINLLDEESLDK